VRQKRNLLCVAQEFKEIFTLFRDALQTFHIFESFHLTVKSK
jgi:hypothetical protein